MVFGGINYIAVVIAALTGFSVGMAWYMLLGNLWMAALGKTKEDLQPRPWPFIASIISLLIMGFMLAGVIGHLGEGQVTVKNGLITGFTLWLGFVVTTMLVNHAFQGAKPQLTIIDGGHWLAVLLAMGAVIGVFGV